MAEGAVDAALAIHGIFQLNIKPQLTEDHMII
jgi:hypothetical protein